MERRLNATLRSRKAEWRAEQELQRLDALRETQCHDDHLEAIRASTVTVPRVLRYCAFGHLLVLGGRCIWECEE